MKIQNHHIQYTGLLLMLVACTPFVQAQAPNGQLYPNAPTQPVKAAPAAYGTGTPVNMVRSWRAIRPFTHDTAISSRFTTAGVHQQTQYYDGLGRPLQTVMKKITPSGKDMISPVVYDRMGRVTWNYLPYPSTQATGSFRNNPFAEQNTYYTNTYNPTGNVNGEKFFYNRIAYEASPLNRVTRSWAAGNSWVGSDAGVSTQYLLNRTTDSVRIWNISMTTGSIPVSTGFYLPGQLFKKLTTDEEGNITVEYTDKEGRTVLKKVQVSPAPAEGPSGWLNTYFIYDDAGNNRFIIQPKGTDYLKGNSWSFGTTQWRNSTIAKELCFSYEYDSRKRMVIKRRPGAGEIWMVYDHRDRLVMVQDSAGRSNNVWEITKYDSLNRPVRTGLWTSTGDRVYHQNQAANRIDYPGVVESAYTLLSEIWYDDYNWVSGSGSGLSSTLITANGITGSAYFYSASNTVFPYPQSMTAVAGKGKITGTRTRVLGSNTWLHAVNFYDKKGRLIQTHATNHTGGKDTITTQYSFSGLELRNLVCHQKAGPQPQHYRLLTKMEYNETGLLTKLSKKAGSSAEVVIMENKYDEQGRLMQRNIGRVRNSANQNTYSTMPLDSLKYDYNIRGWLSGINKNYARGESSGTGWFGMELHYDHGFTNSELAGNIAGVKWKSRGDEQQRAYGFSYDPAGRLTMAGFTQYTGSAWNISAGVDFSVPSIAYDANGNITSMRQKGLLLNTSILIDSLVYGYVSNTNRLNYVTDKVNKPNTTLGDFKEIASNTTQDYWYDGNGNMIKDNNKNISHIRYNHLNLPDSIAVAGKGYIRYVYDAGGNKLGKIISDNNTGTITYSSYVEPFAYTNDTLQYITHEQGRIRPRRPNYSDTMYYDYFEKDHLGNIRMMLSDELMQNVYPAATLEGSISTDGVPNALYREKDYYTITEANVVNRSLATGIPDYQNHNGNPPYNNNPNSDITSNSQKLYRLAATTAGGVTGLGIAVKVMSGDRIDISGKSYYFQNNAGSNYTIPVLNLFAGLLGTPGGVAAAKGVTAAQLNAIPEIANAVTGFLSHPDRNTTTVPKASINYILFDENFKYVTGNFSAVGTANTLKEHLNDSRLQNISVTRNGYLYLYVSNESTVPVFFDNLQLVHTRGPLIEETHYYPFGLTMAGISSKASMFGGISNKKKFNDGAELANEEFSDGSGLELYETAFRSYDPQLGRFWQTDLLADLGADVSPYAYGRNNPVRLNDPLGLKEDTMKTKVLPEVEIVAEPIILIGGPYHNSSYHGIEEYSRTYLGYYPSLKKQYISNEAIQAAFQKWIDELKLMSKMYDVVGSLLGSIELLRSWDDYVELWKQLKKLKIPNLKHPALAIAGTAFKLKAGDWEDQADLLSKILSDYYQMNASGETNSEGIYIISDWQISVYSRFTHGHISESFYDAKSGKFIGSHRIQL